MCFKNVSSSSGFSAIGNADHSRAWVSFTLLQQQLMKVVGLVVKFLLTKGTIASAQDLRDITDIHTNLKDVEGFQTTYLVSPCGGISLLSPYESTTCCVEAWRDLLHTMLTSRLKDSWKALTAHAVFSQFLLAYNLMSSSAAEASSNFKQFIVDRTSSAGKKKLFATCDQDIDALAAEVDAFLKCAAAAGHQSLDAELKVGRIKFTPGKHTIN